MIIEAVLALICLGTRCVFAKYCARVISAYSLVKMNFYAGGLCGVLVLLLCLIGLIDVSASLFLDPYLLKVGTVAGCFFIFADMLAMLSLSKGLTGPASAILSFTAVIVSILTWAINKIPLTATQIVGIFISLAGVVVVSTMGHKIPPKNVSSARAM